MNLPSKPYPVGEFESSSRGDWAPFTVAGMATHFIPNGWMISAATGSEATVDNSTLMNTQHA